jgi:hypothetical protein
MQRTQFFLWPQRVRGEVEQAVRTMRVAEQTENAALRLQLARQATLALLSAYALSKSACPEAIQPGAHSLAQFEALPDDAERHADVIARLKGNSPGAIGERLEYDALVRFFVWLEARIETRTPREALVTRWLVRGAAVAAVPSTIWLLTAPKNLALDKRVSASSICSLTPAPSLGEDALHRVVDGRRNELTFAVCTNTEQKPWVTVDLGQERRIERVVVYPRNDCCYGEDELPLRVQLSQDDKSFETIGTRTVPATLDYPWRFAARGEHARYIRVTADSDQPRHVIISELEVYGS